MAQQKATMSKTTGLGFTIGHALATEWNRNFYVPAPQPVTCSYCQHKNNPCDDTCKTCGASLKD